MGLRDRVGVLCFHLGPFLGTRTKGKVILGCEVLMDADQFSKEPGIHPL